MGNPLPVRAITGHLVWGADGAVWACFEVEPFPYPHRSVRDAREVLPDGLRARGWQVDVVDAYRTTLDELPPDIARRVFLALSAGWQSHPTDDDDIDIVDIYQLADLVMFPSLTEGRGLPIVEASAASVPGVQ